MQWLGLEHDEGPFYQMQRMDRYKEVIQQMLACLLYTSLLMAFTISRRSVRA